MGLLWSVLKAGPYVGLEEINSETPQGPMERAFVYEAMVVNHSRSHGEFTPAERQDECGAFSDVADLSNPTNNIQVSSPTLLRSGNSNRVRLCSLYADRITGKVSSRTKLTDLFSTNSAVAPRF